MRDELALGDLLLAAEGDDRPSRASASLSADSCVTLNIGGSGASTTPRCRHPSIATAASIEWRPEQDHHIARLHGRRRRGVPDSAMAARRSSS